MSTKVKKQTKNIDAQLSDDSSEDIVVSKTQKKTTDKKRKDSNVSEGTGSVNMLKNKRKQSVDKKKAKKYDSDDESEEKPKAKKETKKAKKVDSDSDDSDADAKKMKSKISEKLKKSKKADSDDESEEKPKTKKTITSKKAKDSDDSDSEVEEKKNRKNSKVSSKKGKKAKADSDDEDSDNEIKIVKNNKANDEEDEDPHKEIFMKNLSWNSTQDSITEHLSQFGTIINVKLLTDKMTGRSKGMAFVEFETRKEAQAAIEGCGDLDGRTPQLSFSNQKAENNNQGGFNNRGPRQNGDRNGGFNSTPFNGNAFTVFVGNLGYRTREDTIKNFFSSVGNVVGVRIAKHEDGKAKGFCHVDFDSQDGATAAVTLNGQQIDGRDVRIDASEPRKKQGGFGGGGFGGNRGGPQRGGFNKGGIARPQHGQMGQGGKKTTFNDDSD